MTRVPPPAPKYGKRPFCLFHLEFNALIQYRPIYTFVHLPKVRSLCMKMVLYHRELVGCCSSRAVGTELKRRIRPGTEPRHDVFNDHTDQGLCLDHFPPCLMGAKPTADRKEVTLLAVPARSSRAGSKKFWLQYTLS